MKPHSVQTFFLPKRFASHQTTIRYDTYNLAHRLLNRTDSSYVFVPIRSLQYLAIIEARDIWFVDSLAYAVSANEGGRLITVSWHTTTTERASLEDNIAMEVTYYERDMHDIQIRLTGEFRAAIELMDKRYRDQQIPAEGAKILPLAR